MLRFVAAAAIASAMVACAGAKAEFSTGTNAAQAAADSGQSCLVDSDCSRAGYLCQLNSCVARPECSNDAQCGSGKACLAGQCKVPPPPQADL